MRVNNNYIRVVATFIGEDCSRGFTNGAIYILKMKITDNYIIVSSENNEGLWCPYGSMNTFLENWKLNKDEMTELKRPEKYSQPWMPNITDSLIDIIDKQLVVVPQIVADYIETQKGKLKIFGALKGIAEQRDGYELYGWVFASEDSQELFARAWLDGYTVEKEQLYEVVFSKCEDGDRYLLFANIEFFIGIESMNDGYYRQQFTEAEIKEIDERYWAFSVPVEEE